MSTALDRFLSVGRSIPITGGDDQLAWDALVGAAAEWRGAGNHFSAAYAMQRAIHATGGSGVRLDEAAQSGITDCRSCVEDRPLDSLEALAALSLWPGFLQFYVQSAEIRRHRETLYQELAERLLLVFGERPDSVGFLIRGIMLAGHMDGGCWQAIVPAHIMTIGTHSTFDDGRIVFSLPSALTLFRMLGDYDALHEIVQRFPDEFDDVSIRGWKFAIEAAFTTVGRAGLYAQAADAFAQDVCPSHEELDARGYGWIARGDARALKEFLASSHSVEASPASPLPASLQPHVGRAFYTASRASGDLYPSRHERFTCVILYD